MSCDENPMRPFDGPLWVMLASLRRGARCHCRAARPIIASIQPDLSMLGSHVASNSLNLSSSWCQPPDNASHLTKKCRTMFLAVFDQELRPPPFLMDHQCGGLFHQRNNVIVMFYICCSAQVHVVRWLMIVAITAGLAPAISSAAEQPQRAVLIIDEADPGRGGPTKFSATLRATLDEFAPHVAVYGDSLDLSRFAGPRQEEILH